MTPNPGKGLTPQEWPSQPPARPGGATAVQGLLPAGGPIFMPLPRKGVIAHLALGPLRALFTR